jgi:hypothetical protein
LLLLIEAVAVPLFSVVFLVLNFENAWKPFLVEALGVAMCATGVLLALR